MLLNQQWCYIPPHPLFVWDHFSYSTLVTISLCSPAPKPMPGIRATGLRAGAALPRSRHQQVAGDDSFGARVRLGASSKELLCWPHAAQGEELQASDPQLVGFAGSPPPPISFFLLYFIRSCYIPIFRPLRIQSNICTGMFEPNDAVSDVHEGSTPGCWCGSKGCQCSTLGLFVWEH